jgi:hypothetical protein
MARPLNLAIAALAAAAVLAACAEGSELAPSSSSGAGGAPSGAGGGEGTGGDAGADGSSSRASSATSGPSSTGSAASATSGGGDGGAGGGGEGGGGEGGAGSTTSASSTSSTGGGLACDFASPNDCAGAENLGAVAGDEDGEPVTVQGTTAKWFRIRVEERASGISETDLSYSVSLTSPAGMNYDVIVMEGPQDGDPTCGGTPKAGQSNGVAEVVSASWDDDQGFGGEDDSVWLSIEVRHVSGDQCDLDDRWTLTVQGYP